MEFINRLLIVDLEATCWSSREEQGKQPNEVIEFGYCPFYEENIGVPDSIFIKPAFSEISDFCTELTTIDDDLIQRKGFSIKEGYEKIAKAFSGFSVWGSWGDYDKNQLERMIQLYGLEYFLPKQHINIKRLYGKIVLGNNNIKKVSPVKALSFFKEEFLGTHHRGEDDVYNIARVYKLMTEHYA